MDLNTLWFLIIGFVLAVYIILDGIDLGIGTLSLFTPKDKHKYREQLIEIIGPHWDGNEVWLIVFGGMLFAVFPKVYATLLSGLYLPFIGLLLLFIVRGISIPLRNRYENDIWLNFWDLSFGISSLAIIFLLGVIAANLIQGFTLNQNDVIKLNLLKLTGPYSLWMGAFSVALLNMHGAIYAGRKSSEDLQSFCFRTGLISWFLMLLFAVPAEIVALKDDPSNILDNHLFFFSILLLLLIGSIIYIPWALKSRSFNKAFIASSLVIGRFLTLFYLYSYPNLLRSTETTNNLTIYNASVSSAAMTVMLILTIIAMPVVISYTIYTHFILGK
jgi:cytochrome d ubiquinol oxidase subunit II